MSPHTKHRTPPSVSPLASVTAPLTRLLAAPIVRTFLDEHVFDFYARQLGPQLSLNRILARVEAIRSEARNVVSFVLRPNRNWRGFRPGQHVQLTVEIDGVRHARTYSPSNAPAAGGTVTPTVKPHLGPPPRPHRAGRGRTLHAGVRPGWPARYRERPLARARLCRAPARRGLHTGGGDRYRQLRDRPAFRAVLQGRPWQERRPAAGAGRGRRAQATERMPHGHLPQLHVPQAERRREESAHRRDRRRTRRGHPPVHLGADFGRYPRSLIRSNCRR